MPDLHFLGIRHHGPGSARHVKESIEQIKPDIILVEGPPEGEEMLQWVIRKEMKPPVALLGYVPDNPQNAVFYPFAVYSPEWQAIYYGIYNNIPVRFIDMPLVNKLAFEKEAEENSDSTNIGKQPIAHLAEIAGFEDAEEWWEHQFEINHQPLQAFEAISHLMHSLRETFPDKSEKEMIREAFMRKNIRLAQKEGFSRIVVICGAWHVPALQTMPAQKEDDQLLKNLNKVKVDTTWIPWTNDRLSFESGYGAGVNSPGWYQHLWVNPDDNGVIWLTHVARLFRNNRMDVSSAHVIESVRLAQSLAAMRNLHRPGLKEMNEAVQSVMCNGEEVLMRLVWDQLIVGLEMGEVPEDVPQVPLQKDLEIAIRKLRLKQLNESKSITFDLREENDLAKSILLHRLNVIGVKWGRQGYASGKGTFKEEWVIKWEPEYTIQLLEKAVWGNTLELAANNYLSYKASETNELSDVALLLELAIPADLHEGIFSVMNRMDLLAANTTDVHSLIKAFIPLVKIKRYGNVRKTDLDIIQLITDTLFSRICIGLPSACSGIDEDTAEQFDMLINEMNQSMMLLEDELQAEWIQTLFRIINSNNSIALLHGLSCKLLFDWKATDSQIIAAEFNKALSIANDPAYSAMWLQGFLSGNVTTLLLDDVIWGIINNWVGDLDEEIFQQLIPLLRRTFATYTSPEKQKIAIKAKSGISGHVTPVINRDFDTERAIKIVPVLNQLMGIN
ncbi:DUF5682 family protein [Solitalea canadensis]|uniref:Uncharacterized protein n=1 Tax=Solitalea canadensis (strain ATCC 29591 / DSM 3403 / JCM 21819 / LMG 8368 / NBRC 15130 / NCIMB 12057 / USAM 9D) TaxID=929556 RepID=H8KW82_SOLCM|nr:DUF5682 family protein [Solitalea canadensis]AFD07103.1 hypothetical protein Solca_2048 [Solitalea canadensis DSM 3403]